jgi:metallo-beta-lactamase class B
MPAEWLTPIEPFHIVGNLYYVGSQDLASFLIVTPEGNILINSGTESSPPLIKASIEKLKFKYTDIKVLLISHAHNDHDAGSAAIIKDTGARYMVMDGDVPVVESGGKTDFAYPSTLYPKAHVDRVLHDGDLVRLGGIELTAHKTAGHTRGCTTWTFVAESKGAVEHVVIVGGWYVNPGFRLVDKPARKASYPGIAADYRHTFEVLHSLPCDVFLGAHGSYFDLAEKLARAKLKGEAVWLDPAGYQKSLNERQLDFEQELKKQQGAS